MKQTVKEPATAPIGTKDIDIKHKVLLLGSGLVTGPVVDYLMRDQSIRLTIGRQAILNVVFYPLMKFAILCCVITLSDAGRSQRCLRCDV